MNYEDFNLLNFAEIKQNQQKNIVKDKKDQQDQRKSRQECGKIIHVKLKETKHQQYIGKWVTYKLFTHSQLHIMHLL